MCDLTSHFDLYGRRRPPGPEATGGRAAVAAAVAVGYVVDDERAVAKRLDSTRVRQVVAVLDPQDARHRRVRVNVTVYLTRVTFGPYKCAWHWSNYRRIWNKNNNVNGDCMDG